MGRHISGVLSCLSSRKGHTKALSVSVLSQIVSSGTNFLLGLYLVRTLTPMDFGLYGIGFAISLFYAGIGNAIFLTQMVVHAPDKSADDRLPYAARMLVAVVGFSSITLLASSFVFFVGGIGWAPLEEYTGYGIAVTMAAVAYLLKEFFVRHAYNIQRESWALTIHIALAASLILMLTIQYVYMQTITVETALWIYALSHSVAALCGYVLSRVPLRSVSRAAIVADLREAWSGGRWATLTNFVYFLRIQAHTVIVAASMGPVGVAKLNAARLFVTPAMMLTPALSQVFLPRMAKARRHDIENVKHAGRVFTFLLLAVAVLYSVLILFAFDFISPLVVGDQYDSLFWLVIAWCVYACVLSIRNGQEITVQALKHFKRQMLANTASALITLLGVSILTSVYGVMGAVAGLILGEFSLFIFLWLSANAKKYLGFTVNGN